MRLISTLVLALLVLAACGSMPSASSRGDVLCPTSGPPPSTRFCVTHQEQTLGEQPAQFRTMPASFFIGAGVELTTDSSDVPRFTRSQLYTLMERKLHKKVIEAALVQWHGIDGKPARGQLTWVVNDTPAGFRGVSSFNAPGPLPSGAASATVPNTTTKQNDEKPLEVLTVNASTGKITGSMAT